MGPSFYITLSPSFSGLISLNSNVSAVILPALDLLPTGTCSQVLLNLELHGEGVLRWTKRSFLAVEEEPVQLAWEGTKGLRQKDSDVAASQEELVCHNSPRAKVHAP